MSKSVRCAAYLITRNKGIDTATKGKLSHSVIQYIDTTDMRALARIGSTTDLIQNTSLLSQCLNCNHTSAIDVAHSIPRVNG